CRPGKAQPPPGAQPSVMLHSIPLPFCLPVRVPVVTLHGGEGIFDNQLIGQTTKNKPHPRLIAIKLKKY
ncbi:hypothetical protein, partial [Enterobacter intestinihominis]